MECNIIEDHTGYDIYMHHCQTLTLFPILQLLLQACVTLLPHFADSQNPLNPTI
eukprot:UN23687